MKLVIVLTILVSTTQLSLAKPQYGGGRPTQRPFQPQPQTGPQCKTEYETVNKIEYEEEQRSS